MIPIPTTRPARSACRWRPALFLLPLAAGLAALAGRAELAAAPIKVNLAGASPVPKLPDLSEGVPLDLEFYASRTRRPGETNEQALARLVGELTGPRPAGGRGRGMTESVVRTTSLLANPCLYTDATGIHPKERVPKEWGRILNRRKGLFGRVVQAVGRVEFEHLDELFNNPAADPVRVPSFAGCVIAGTCFVVAPNVVMTNAHVARYFAEEDLSFRKDQRSGRPAVVRVNFASNYEDDPDLVRVTRVLYLGPQDRRKGPDVALLEIAGRRGTPLPLPLQTREPASREPNRPVLVCGYPSTLDRDSEKWFRVAKVRRVSLGQLLGEEWVDHEHARRCLTHNCPTLGGNSGSPLVDLDTGLVWGLHFLGDPDHANKAELMWEVCRIPEVRKHLGAAATNPPEPLQGLDGEPARVPADQPRPSLLVGREGVEAEERLPAEWRERLKGHRDAIKRAQASVALTRLEGHPTLETTGTAFMIAPGVVALPRHAAEAFANPDLTFRAGAGGKPIRVGVDFARTAREQPAARFDVSRVLYVAPPDGPDFALLELKPRDDLPFPPPLQLERERPKADQAGRAVYVVGHPFFDARTPVELFNVIYATPLGVKHFAPGEVMGLQRVDTDSEAPTVRWALTHDCSTGGGDAGAPLIDLESGKVLGMHYGGEYRVANYAVPVWAALGDPRVQGLAPIRQILKEK